MTDEKTKFLANEYLWTLIDGYIQKKIKEALQKQREEIVKKGLSIIFSIEDSDTKCRELQTLFKSLKEGK